MLWIIGVVGSPGVRAKDVLEVESRYAGEGWFYYRVRTLEDPFFAGIAFGQLVPYPFTNYVTTRLPSSWTNYYYDGHWGGIMYDSTLAQPRINEIVFLARSTSTNFKKGELSTTISLTFPPFIFRGITLGGYVNMEALVPCSPQESDGSYARLFSRLELLPDIRIDELIVTNGEVHGLKFSWAMQSTMELQGSDDLEHWSSITQFAGNPPQTVWTTGAVLNPAGPFYRLLLIYGGDYSPLSAVWGGSGAPVMPNLAGRAGWDSIPGATQEVDTCELAWRVLGGKLGRASARSGSGD